MIKHKLRQVAAKRLEPYMRYTSYPISGSEYLGTFDGSKQECVQMLQSYGYHYQMFAAIKLLHGVEEDDGSYAFIPTEHPEVVKNSHLNTINPRNCQYHVHLYERDDTVELYGHYEIHPYPWTPTLSIQRSLDHYSPTKKDDDTEWSEVTYIRGVLDSRLESELQ